MQVNELKANRSIRAQELSVVRWSNVDKVPASGPKKNDRCVSAKRSFSRKLSCTVRRGPRKLPNPVSATPDHWL